jgi:hypothetical protein
MDNEQFLKRYTGCPLARLVRPPQCEIMVQLYPHETHRSDLETAGGATSSEFPWLVNYSREWVRYPLSCSADSAVATWVGAVLFL